jgi:N-methylhydantoinase B/oxoprolinase/acetone carboxylase alpha subunit
MSGMGSNYNTSRYGPMPLDQNSMYPKVVGTATYDTLKMGPIGMAGGKKRKMHKKTHKKKSNKKRKMHKKCKTAKRRR